MITFLRELTFLIETTINKHNKGRLTLGRLFFYPKRQFCIMVLRESSFDSLMPNSNAVLKKTAKHPATPKQPIPASRPQDDGARLIASERGEILFYSPAFAKLCLSSYNVEGQNIADILDFDDPSEAFQSAGIFSSHKNTIHALRDGQYDVTIKENNKNLSLQFDWIEPQNGMRYLIASAEQVTARDKLLQYVAEKIEEKNNRQLDSHHFLDLSFDAQIITTLDGRFLSVNSVFSQILGAQFNDIQSRTLIDFIHPDSRSDALIFYQSAAENDSPHVTSEFESCFITATNQIVWMHWKNKRIENKIYSIGRDITATKNQQQALERQQKKLSEAEAIGHMGQWRWQVGAKHIDFSDALFRIFGLDSKTFTPTLDNITQMIHRSDAGRMIQVFQRAVIEQNDYDMDFRLTRPDGKIRYIRCEGRCETDHDDDVIALYGIMQDVTEAMHRELDLRQAKDSVERAYAAKTQFLANMSHELRTPLNAIIGFSEMMQRQLLGPIGTEKYLEYISGILESGEHLLDLISDILDMSRIEAGKYELSLEKFNIAKVIRMAVHMMEGRAVDSEVKISTKIENENLIIIADRRAVMQMILNLLSNAVKFSHQGGHVTIHMIERPEHLSIKVEDEGIGIPANKLANITQPFEQAEPHYTREHEGSGLGLAITKELAELHKGNLHIESALNVGTTVTIRLPHQTK